MTAADRLFSPAPHADYRRRARRIRHAFARQPALRMRALRELAHAEDARRAFVPAPAATPAPVASLPAGAAHELAERVRQRMNGPVLRFSERTHLIRWAERRGIGRFEANLIIAAVQHERGARRRGEHSQALPSRIPAITLAFCATQGAIAMGLWWLVG